VRMVAFVMRDLIDSVLAGVSTGLTKLTGRVRQATIASDVPAFSSFFEMSFELPNAATDSLCLAMLFDVFRFGKLTCTSFRQ